MGKPALFIRFAGCPPPHCPWCDSSFSWKISPAQMQNEQELLIEIQKITDSVIKQNNFIIVITGGEPFWNWHEAHTEWLKKISEVNYTIQFETSGRVVIPKLTDIFPKPIVVCSPKYINGHWDFIESNVFHIDFYKFVVFNKEDINQIQKFIDNKQIPNNKVFLMAGGQTRDELLIVEPWLFSECSQRRFSFSPRLHISIFNDNRRGV